jgi:hypothetical protein
VFVRVAVAVAVRVKVGLMVGVFVRVGVGLGVMPQEVSRRMLSMYRFPVAVTDPSRLRVKYNRERGSVARIVPKEKLSPMVTEF